MMSDACLQLEHVSIAYGGTTVIRDCSFTVQHGEILSLLGPSGCGKSTLLKAVAGLLRVQAGEIRMQGRVVASAAVNVAPQQREVGMIFQDYALFPHLTALENIAFGLQHLPAKERLARARDMLAVVLKLVVVTGSADKTSAKIAIGTILAQQFRVRLREEEPATRTDALLQIMGLGWPQRGWFRGWRTLRSAKKLVKRPQHEVQVVVQEFSPRQLGDNAWLGEYLKPDVAVITAVTDGRLQLDHSVDAIAQEMLAAANVSRMALINRDDIEGRFANYLTNPHISTYGTSSVAEYNYQDDGFSITDGHTGTIHLPEHQPLVVNLRLVGEHNIRPAVAAAAVGQALGMDQSAVLRGLAALRPLPGRMNVLRGAEGSWLIDDSYSSTPLTALAV